MALPGVIAAALLQRYRQQPHQRLVGQRVVLLEKRRSELPQR